MVQQAGQLLSILLASDDRREDDSDVFEACEGIVDSLEVLVDGEHPFVVEDFERQFRCVGTIGVGVDQVLSATGVTSCLIDLERSVSVEVRRSGARRLLWVDTLGCRIETSIGHRLVVQLPFTVRQHEFEGPMNLPQVILNVLEDAGGLLAVVDKDLSNGDLDTLEVGFPEEDGEVIPCLPTSDEIPGHEHDKVADFVDGAAFAELEQADSVTVKLERHILALVGIREDGVSLPVDRLRSDLKSYGVHALELDVKKRDELFYEPVEEVVVVVVESEGLAGFQKNVEELG